MENQPLRKPWSEIAASKQKSTVQPVRSSVGGSPSSTVRPIPLPSAAPSEQKAVTPTTRSPSLEQKQHSPRFQLVSGKRSSRKRQSPDKKGDKSRRGYSGSNSRRSSNIRGDQNKQRQPSQSKLVQKDNRRTRQDQTRQKSQSQSRQKSQDQSRQKTQDKGRQKIQDKSREQTHNQNRQKTQGQNRQKTQEQNQQQAQDQSRQKTRDQSRQTPQDQCRQTSLDQSLPKPLDQSLPKPQDQNLPKPHNQSLPKFQDKSLPKPQDQSLPIAQEQSLPIAQEQSLPIAQEQSLPIAQEQILENPVQSQQVLTQTSDSQYLSGQQSVHPPTNNQQHQHQQYDQEREMHVQQTDLHNTQYYQSNQRQLHNQQNQFQRSPGSFQNSQNNGMAGNQYHSYANDQKATSPNPSQNRRFSNGGSDYQSQRRDRPFHLERSKYRQSSSPRQYRGRANNRRGGRGRGRGRGYNTRHQDKQQQNQLIGNQNFTQNQVPMVSYPPTMYQNMNRLAVNQLTSQMGQMQVGQWTHSYPQQYQQQYMQQPQYYSPASYAVPMQMQNQYYPQMYPMYPSADQSALQASGIQMAPPVVGIPMSAGVQPLNMPQLRTPPVTAPPIVNPTDAVTSNQATAATVTTPSQTGVATVVTPTESTPTTGSDAVVSADVSAKAEELTPGTPTTSSVAQPQPSEPAPGPDSESGPSVPSAGPPVSFVCPSGPSTAPVMPTWGAGGVGAGPPLSPAIGTASGALQTLTPPVHGGQLIRTASPSDSHSSIPSPHSSRFGTPQTDPATLELPATNIFSIDVECVATGLRHSDRSVGQIALVNQNEVVLLNLYVKPAEQVFSYLSGLTGLSETLLDEHGMSLDDAKVLLRKCLPSDAVLVGQNIQSDVAWLDLKEGVDFASMVDLSGLWRVWNPRYGMYTKFSLNHEAFCLLNSGQSQVHDAAFDALLSVKLYKAFLDFQQSPDRLLQARQLLLSTPPQASFSKQFPYYDDVCMGNKKMCRCGAPFSF
eukprot:159559_1